MRKTFHTVALSVWLLATPSMTPAAAAPASATPAQFSFGIRIGEPPEPRAYRVPPQPGPEYEWIEGYWYPERGRYVWHNGYWTLPPYQGAYWVEPYYVGGEYFAGHWEGPRGSVMHDHRWDRFSQRDEGRDPTPADRGNNGRR